MLPQSFFRALLRCYPAAFREEYGGPMRLLFDEELSAARGRPLEELRLWIRAASDVLTIAPLEHCHVIRQDLRYALRMIAARPGFAAVAILSLALGVGANTAIFSLWNGLLRAPLPGVRNPSTLVMLTDPDQAGMWHGNSIGERAWLTFAEFEELRDRAASFSGVMASESSIEHFPARVDGGPEEEMRGRLVSGAYFDVLGVAPALGRLFTATDDREASPAAVISYACWQRRFGGRPDVLGKTLTVGNTVLTIVGVAGRDFHGETAGQQLDVWAPIRMQPALLPGENRLHDTPPEKIMWLHVFARLKPGVTAGRAGQEANAIFHAGLESFYGGVPADAERRGRYLDQRLVLRPGGRGASETRGDFSTAVSALMAAVGLLLLIACANLANLLLARGAARRAEMSLRLSLGASRGRLVRQLLTESFVLSVAGGLASLLAAAVIYAALAGMIARSDRNFQLPFALDLTVLAFTAGATVLAALLFGALPAWQITRSEAGAGLREQARGAVGRSRWGRGLVAFQLALSLPLLIGAGLLARTVYNLGHEDFGYATDHLSIVNTNSRAAGYDTARSRTLFLTLVAQIRAIPGVQAVTVSHNGLFTGGNSGDPVIVEGYTPRGENDRGASWEMVGPRYFSTLGIPLLLGREILDSDTSSAPRVCVINESFAKKFFAGRNPLGLHVGIVDEGPHGNTVTTYAVAGVARDARTSTLRGEVEPRVYEPIVQNHGDNVKRASFLIRSATPVLPAVREVFRRIDPGLRVTTRSMEEQLQPWTAPERTIASVVSVFGGVALLLAAIGLYGLLSYSVARRQGEIAVRIALGAQGSRVVAMIMGETVRLIAIGLAAGAALAWVSVRIVRDSLFGVAPDDPATVAAAIAVLVVVALAAAFLPARRASRLDPMTALRGE